MTNSSNSDVRGGSTASELGGAGNTADSPAARRAVVSGAVGSALEWFDFSVYGALSATVFPKLFFPELAPGVGLLASFATFGAGFFARPLGGLVFGVLGDRVGRKRVLTWTLLLMGAASTLIGLLPTYGSVGFVAPLLLVMLRFLQGLGLGGEATGSQLLSMEHAPEGKRGRNGALMAIGSPISQVVATLALTALAATMSAEAFAGWGWRVPFLFSVVLIGVGVYIRARVAETPLFLADARASDKRDRPSALTVFRTHPRILTLLVLTWASSASVFYICVTFAISYLTGTLGLSNSISFSLLLTGNALSIAAGVLGGWLSDRIGRRKVFAIGTVGLLVSVVLLFPLLDLRSWWASAAVISLALCSVQLNAGVQPAFYAEALPTSVRYTGSAMGYTLANLIFSAPTPFIAAFLLGLFGGNPIGVTGYGLVIVIISAVALYFMPERYDRPLER
ncbi:MFS transporter [Pseudonocardia acaciae]|uniref:MFS transporter n=1 Tax=Pseudonocardia acaciae TaxID=551276 RepID=UPI00048D961F|nr:MFS transporter [Pseudonocardia acaciae]